MSAPSRNASDSQRAQMAENEFGVGKKQWESAFGKMLDGAKADARKQGYRIRKDIALFVNGWVTGFAHAITEYPKTKKRTRR
jgi:hypothetical protein